jgi:hypothetical protein
MSAIASRHPSGTIRYESSVFPQPTDENRADVYPSAGIATIARHHDLPSHAFSRPASSVAATGMVVRFNADTNRF